MKLFEVAMIKKAGFVPYVIVGDTPLMMFMTPSDADFGGDKPSLAKGGIDRGELPLEAGFREAEEELGLKHANLMSETIELGWQGIVKGDDETYHLSIFIGQVKDTKNFNKPHFETGRVDWLTAQEFSKVGRITHRKIVRSLSSLISAGNSV